MFTMTRSVASAPAARTTRTASVAPRIPVSRARIVSMRADAGDRAKSAASDAKSNINQGANKAGDRIQEAGESIKEKAADVKDNVSQGAKDVGRNIQDGAQKLADTVSGKAEEGKKNVERTAQDVKDRT